MNRQIGKVDKKVIELLNLAYEEEKPIFIGEANLKHMQDAHPEDFQKYG